MHVEREGHDSVRRSVTFVHPCNVFECLDALVLDYLGAVLVRLMQCTSRWLRQHAASQS